MHSSFPAFLVLLSSPLVAQGTQKVLGPPASNILRCVESLSDQNGGACLEASSAPTFGLLFPYPGLNNSFDPADGSVVSGGESNVASVAHSTVGGGLNNTASSIYSTVGGGRGNSASFRGTVSGGTGNTASGGAAIGGGSNNNAGSDATIGGGEFCSAGSRATVGGGFGNDASGSNATIGGGYNNYASAIAATVGGGDLNTASASFSTVGGGDSNEASGARSTVGGGLNNTASFFYATVGGGVGNEASGPDSTVSGGRQNIASGSSATVPGGGLNAANALNSFAAGFRSKANHAGSFVWGDGFNADKTSSASNQFNVYASGGTRIFSNTAATSGVLLAPGSGAWITVSDRDAKENFNSVDGRDVLEQLASIPITTWNYKSQVEGVQHMGPMAQDFYAAFGLGLDDKGISTIDADGVALAAIQGLRAEKDAEIAALRKRLEALEAMLAERSE